MLKSKEIISIIDGAVDWKFTGCNTIGLEDIHGSGRYTRHMV
jgi:hypothetical protein